MKVSRVVPPLFLATAAVALLPSLALAADLPAAEKEWTILVFLNGHNNLDPYGAMDINEMETVGSTDQVNVVVQWASLKNGETRRLYVTQDSSLNQVGSQVVERLPAVDMGDHRSLTEFLKWGVTKYPAKRYFVDVWDHGNGWHKRRGLVGARDISWDDRTGSFMTTEQLGDSIREVSAFIGRKIDIYGSDACLMSMAEVAGEMSGAVSVFLGSEEVEPAKGWAYEGFLAPLAAKPQSTPAEVAGYLTDSFVKSYQGGSQGRAEVTFSAFDLEQTAALEAAVKGLGDSLRALSRADAAKVVSAGKGAISFTYDDYVDVVDFLDQLDLARVPAVDSRSVAAVRDAVSRYVITNKGTPSYARARGVAFWLPTSRSTLSTHINRYNGLEFAKATGWGDALSHLLAN